MVEYKAGYRTWLVKHAMMNLMLNAIYVVYEKKYETDLRLAISFGEYHLSSKLGRL